MRPNRQKYIKAALTHFDVTLNQKRKQWQEDRAAWAEKELKRHIASPRVAAVLKSLKGIGFKDAHVKVNEHEPYLEIQLTEKGWNKIAITIDTARFKSCRVQFTFRGIPLERTASLKELVAREYDRMQLDAQLDNKPFDMPLVKFLGHFTDIKECME